MHSIAEIGTTVPAFLGKLWTMVEDPVTNDLIAWSSTGNSFVIKDEIRFAKEILPMYYKHNNMASFIRQLNMYGFHKIVSPDAGSMKLEAPDEIKFTHPYFMQGHPYLLDHIKRKIGVSKTLSNVSEEKSPQVLSRVFNEMKQMKSRQDNMDSRLRAMKIENVALWRELSIMRQKHIKQQQIVNKLIQFLITIVQQNHSSFSFKRKYPRMLQHHKQQVKGRLEDDGEDNIDPDSLADSPLGPVIHELDPAEALLETVVEEAQAETPTDDLFLHQTPEQMTVNVEMPMSVEDTTDDSHNETIFGIEPDDTFVFSHELPGLNIQQQTGSPSGISSKTPSFFLTNKKQKGISTSPYVKVITGKPREKKSRIKVLQNYKPHSIKRPTEVIEINPEEVVITDERTDAMTSKPTVQRNKLQPKVTSQLPQPKVVQKVLKKHPQLKLVISQPQAQTSQTVQQLRLQSQPQSQNNQKISQLVLKLQPQSQNKQTISQLLLHSQPKSENNQTLQSQPNLLSQVDRNSIPQKSDLKRVKKLEAQKQKIKQPQRIKEEVVKNQQQIKLGNIVTQQSLGQEVGQGLQQTVGQELPLPSVAVITVPYDAGSGESILPDLDTSEFPPLSMEEPENVFESDSLVVEVPPATTSPAEPSPQDLLGGSPALLNDPVMTPQCSSVPTPVNDMQVACVDEVPLTSPSLMTRSEMDSHLDSVQADLESLKELLQCEGISLDANALLGYLNDDPMSFNMSDPGSLGDPTKQRENSGNEVMTYNPSLMDLTDMMGNDWCLPSPSGHTPVDDTMEEVNTPLFMPLSPSMMPPSSKKRKK